MHCPSCQIWDSEARSHSHSRPSQTTSANFETRNSPPNHNSRPPAVNHLFELRAWGAIPWSTRRSRDRRCPSRRNMKSKERCLKMAGEMGLGWKGMTKKKESVVAGIGHSWKEKNTLDPDAGTISFAVSRYLLSSASPSSYHHSQTSSPRSPSADRAPANTFPTDPNSVRPA